MKSLVVATLAALAIPYAAFAQAASGAPEAGQQSSRQSMQLTAEEFVEKATGGNLAEVEMGKLAQEKGQREDVKQFGERMVQDHGRANEQLQAAAQQMTLPSEPDPEHQQKIQELSALSPEEFDREYSRFMVEDHEKDISLYESAMQSLQEEELKTYAQDTLPVLQEHLRMAQAMREELAATPGQAAPPPR